MNASQEFLFGIEKIVNIVFLFIRNSLRTPTQCQRAVGTILCFRAERADFWKTFSVDDKSCLGQECLYINYRHIDAGPGFGQNKNEQGYFTVMPGILELFWLILNSRLRIVSKTPWCAPVLPFPYIIPDIVSLLSPLVSQSVSQVTSQSWATRNSIFLCYTLQHTKHTYSKLQYFKIRFFKEKKTFEIGTF